LLSNQEIKQEVGGEASEEGSGEEGEGQHIRTRNQQKRRGGVHQLVYPKSLAIMVIVKKHGNDF